MENNTYMWNKPALYHTAFLHYIRCINFMDMFSVYAHVDFQYESIVIVNSRLVSPTLTYNIAYSLQ